MQIRYLTIEREYGSGGTAIAKRVSAETGIPCYGREILEATAKRHNTTVERLEQYEETITGSALYSLHVFSQMQNTSPDMLTADAHLFLAEQSVIRSLAARGPAIFLGHCAAEACKDMPGVLRVFIRCSDMTQKRRRIIEEYRIPESKAETVRKQFDRKRANYFYGNTMHRWDDWKQYDLILDSGILERHNCVQILKACFDA